STLGYRAAGVPGTVAGMAFALKKYGSGKLTWSELIEPARRLAIDGFVVTHRTEKRLQDYQAILSLFADSRRVFLREGKLYREGEILRQPELAATLGRLQRKGPREFYEGKTARLIAEDMQHNGGLITRQDLRDYTPKERVPLSGSYRGYGIISMPPPSSGGAVLIEMLNILEGFDLQKLHPFSSEYYHLLVEAMRRAYADRAEYMGDTDFSSVPIEGLIEKAYAERQRSTINPEHASLSSEIGAGKPTGYESTQTTHFTIVDAAGNAVSNTYTLNLWFGSGVVAKGTGVLLNNEMDDFASKPGEPNSYGAIQSERNAIAPRKRPLSSMTPTFVLRPDGTLYFAIGAKGGTTITNTVLQIISNVIDHGMNMQKRIEGSDASTNVGQPSDCMVWLGRASSTVVSTLPCAFQVTPIKIECCRDERFVKARRVNPKNFLAELKRRNVYKVAIAYGVVAWLLIQVATQVFPFFEIPNWVVRLVVLVI